MTDMRPSRTARVEIDFGDGTYPFALRLGELMELDEKFQTGPLVMVNAMNESSWRVPWIREIVRLGLIGGGMMAHKALTMTRRYVDEVPDWVRNSAIASAVLSAALLGIEAESPGKSNEAADQAEATATGETDASPSPLSTMPPGPAESQSVNSSA